ncbi:MAG: family 43 glycosylhydrolase [Oscillospiraceae bacterium]|nr:family 43 glycosylhydrolase [Oscillospiraceae bacterium]
MKKKTLLLIIPIALLLIAALVVGLLFLQNQEGEMTIVSESGDIFYRNDLLTVGADPDVIYISEGEEAGYYYMYITSDDLGGAGFLAYKSRDLVEWVCTGVALNPEGTYDETTGYTTISYGFSNYWAPEVVYDQESKLYYMFYTCNRYDTSFSTGLNFYGDIAVSDSPAGPFVQYNKYLGKEPVVVDEEKKILTYAPVFDFSNMDPGHPLYEQESDGYMKIIDINPFLDPKTGAKYVYFCHDLGANLAISESSIYVMALHDDFTPDYTQVHALTMPNRQEFDSKQDVTMNEGKVNEAPHMIYNEESGKYYLLYSANSYLQKTYCVRVAVGDSPTGPFRKLSQAEGGYLLYADSHWTWASGTGHCSVVNRDGQDYIVYHAHLDRVNGNSKRAIAMDELHWAENGNGLLVPVANGPSATFMPLTTYQYENVAGKATVTADHIADGMAEAMTDGIIVHRDSSFLQDTLFDGSAATVKLQFEKAETVSGIAVYNSYNYDYLYSSISAVKLHLAGGGTKVIKDLSYDWSLYYTEEGYVVPGGSIAMEFEPAEVTAIEIAMPASDTQYAISEIAVMAKRQNRPVLSQIDGWQTDAPADDTVTFDGIVHPEEYTGEKIAFADTNGVTMTMYSKMAEEGVFFGFHSNDTSVYVNPEQAIFQNTSVEIQLGMGGTDQLNANVLQIRYGLDGAVEGWIGVQSAVSYEYMRAYVNSASKVHIYGELNSSNCTGYDVECYIPYRELNLKEKPESLICAPSFNTRKDYDASGRTTWTLMVGSSFQDPTSWYRIDASGQTVMTDGFRVSGDQITQTGGSNQFYYFGDELLDAYYLNVDVQIGDVLNNDGYPKFGVVSKSLDSLLGYYFDYAGEAVNSIGRIAAQTTEFIGTQWQWETNSSHTFGIQSCVSLNADQTVNIELIRYENQLVMLVNGRFMLSDLDVKGLEDGSIPGLFFFNTEANITVNHYVTKKDTVKHYMAAYMPEIALDGNLSDWDKENTRLATEKDSESGNEMTVYGYRTQMGVYLAYEVHHGYQPKVYMWNEGSDERGVWYYNTNAEFWINNDHFAATAFGDSGYMVKTMKTTEDLTTGSYTTVVEAFIPAEIVGAGDAAVGFAFKTCDQDYATASQVTEAIMKFRGDPWWFFAGRFPTDLAARFILK